MNKSAVANALVKANGFAPFRFLNRSKLPVLMYHRFSVTEEPGKTSLRTFENHLAYISKHYKVISLSEAVSRMNGGGALPERSLVITIDDGYSDFYDIAYPILKKFGLPATLYIVTGFIDKECWIWTDKARFVLSRTLRGRVVFEAGAKNIERELSDMSSRLAAAGMINAELKKMTDDVKNERLKYLAAELNVLIPDLPPEEFTPISWDDVRELQNSTIGIGSHTETHPILTNVSGERLGYELATSLSSIRNTLQNEKIHFCYPNGNHTQRERDAVERAGYASAVTTEIRLCEDEDDKFLMPRVDAEPEMHRFIQATSGFDQMKSRLRRSAPR